jgi:hypothetical protein
VLFFSVARPESQNLPEMSWELDEALTLRSVASAALLPDRFTSDGRPHAGHGDVWREEELWASFATTSTSSPQRARQPFGSSKSRDGEIGGPGVAGAEDSSSSHAGTSEQVGGTGKAEGKEEASAGVAGSCGKEPDQVQLTCVGPDAGVVCRDSHFGGTRARSGKRRIGVNVSLIPGTGWGHLGYEIFFGLYHDQEGLGWEPLLLGDVHPAGVF